MPDTGLITIVESEGSARFFSIEARAMKKCAELRTRENAIELAYLLLSGYAFLLTFVSFWYI